MAEPLDPALRPGANLTPDQLVSMYIESKRLKRAADEANAKFRSHKAKMDKAGVDLKALADLERLEKMDPEERTQRLRTMFRYGQQLDITLAKQADLFDGKVDRPGDKMTTEQRRWAADEAGYEAGKNGMDRKNNPYEAGSDFFATWDDAWVRGQATIADRMKPKKGAKGDNAGKTASEGARRPRGGGRRGASRMGL